MIDLILLGIILSILTVVCGGFFFFLWKFRYLLQGEGLVSVFRELTSSIDADYSSEEGGIASAAKRGEKVFLYELARGVLDQTSGGLYDLFVDGIRSLTSDRFDMDAFLKRNPYAGIRIMMNPQVQQLIQRFDLMSIAQRFQQGAQPGGLDNAAW